MSNTHCRKLLVSFGKGCCIIRDTKYQFCFTLFLHNVPLLFAAAGDTGQDDNEDDVEESNPHDVEAGKLVATIYLYTVEYHLFLGTT